MYALSLWCDPDPASSLLIYTHSTTAKGDKHLCLVISKSSQGVQNPLSVTLNVSGRVFCTWRIQHDSRQWQCDMTHDIAIDTWYLPRYFILQMRHMTMQRYSIPVFNCCVSCGFMCILSLCGASYQVLQHIVMCLSYVTSSVVCRTQIATNNIQCGTTRFHTGVRNYTAITNPLNGWRIIQFKIL